MLKEQPFEFIETTYEKLQESAVNLMMGEDKLVIFSIFKDNAAPGTFDSTSGDRQWHVLAPDILSPKPVFEGDVVFYSDSWRITDHMDNDGEYTSRKYTNPTWADIINACNDMLNSTCKYALYLEYVNNGDTVDGVQRAELVLGS